MSDRVLGVGLGTSTTVSGCILVVGLGTSNAEAQSMGQFDVCWWSGHGTVVM